MPQMDPHLLFGLLIAIVTMMVVMLIAQLVDGVFKMKIWGLFCRIDERLGAVEKTINGPDSDE